MKENPVQKLHAAHHTLPLEAWRITENEPADDTHFLRETLFSVGNGYIGLRGTEEEGYSGAEGQSLDGSYLNGFYESEAIHYPENACGLARTNQFMLNVPNAKCLRLRLENEDFDPRTGTLESYQRTLDFRTGLLTRSLVWLSPSGRRVRVHSERLVSFRHPNLFAIRYEVTPLNFDGTIQLISALNGQVSNMAAGDDPRVGSAISGAALEQIGEEWQGNFAALTHRTHNSGFTLCTAMQNHLLCEQTFEAAHAQHGKLLEQIFTVKLSRHQPVQLCKYASYHSSRDFPETQLTLLAQQLLAQAQASGFKELAAQQQAYLDDFWQQADVEIEGDDALQQGMHFNQFHLLQSVGRDGKTNIAAKGLTGEGYEGHYFWDTEIYIFPFFLYNKPEIARKLLEYRYQYLPQARTRARQMAHSKGALYPWRTIAGEECSAYFPAGTAQYHINADIAYAIRLYLQVTGDTEFLLEQGAEIVLETARLWMELGHFSSNGATGREQFCINEVTGPDEYTALVNNNYYTNAMAQMHLRFAAQIAMELAQHHAEKWQQLRQTLSLSADEINAWERAAEQMFLPYDAALRIHAQDDAFLSKKPWNFKDTPADNYPLLLHYHPLVIYRHQVCKQADVVLALLLLSEQFSLEDKRRDFDFYEKVTTHDSSLSTCIFSIIANEIGYQDKAYAYFMQTARLDLDDTHGNTHYGVHTAAMAGTWLGIAYGFAGLRIVHELPRFAPVLPPQWQHYQFHIHFQGQLLQVRVDRQQVSYCLLRGQSLQLLHHEQRITLNGQGALEHVPFSFQEPQHA
ncbi:MAG: glycoside hydrolase family 65 protein [Burkholderiales bacterium]|nr:glycoside hydrolase family 65 protein [Burkholderiales bacterium]